MMKDLFARYFHLPIQRPGWSLFAVAGGATVILSALYLPLGLLAFAGFIYLHVILAMPRRKLADISASQVVSPIDGQILWIYHDRANAETIIRLRPDWLNSHIVYAPVTGKIDQQIWYDGQFSAVADEGRAPAHNARQEITFMPEGSRSSEDRINLCLHGTPASRIIQSCTQEGRHVTPETAVGLGILRPKIDIHLPANFTPALKAGQRCLAGETVIAHK